MDLTPEGGTAELENLPISAEEFRAAGQFDKAREIQEQVQSGWLSLRGENDYQTLGAQHFLALILFDLGEHRAAEALQQKVAAQNERQLGTDSEITLRNLGQLEQLRDVQGQILQIRIRKHGPSDRSTLQSMRDLILTKRRLDDADVSSIEWDFVKKRWGGVFRRRSPS
jgi:hypothetical protein